ncbi:GntR family transcriptional regulator [Moorella naiadis]|uniref:GntR family transcriptional regulator n=1 Tax=Moorella naiadis (nom. illeg.) TaxID=3093670 RepID=UPI003D9C7E08
MPSANSKGQINFYTKGQLVYETLKEQITSGELKPGQRFSAAEIAAQLGVSRTPVNEAVKLLVEQGLVTLLPNVGFEIKTLSWPEIKELMYIRRELEKLAVTWAIARAPQEKITALRRLSREIRRVVKEKDKECYYTLNKEFHFNLYEAAAAPRLLDLHLRIWDYEGWYAAQLRNVPEKLILLCDDHDRLVDALGQRDKVKARQILYEHVEHCLQVLAENLQVAGYPVEPGGMEVDN